MWPQQQSVLSTNLTRAIWPMYSSTFQLLRYIVSLQLPVSLRTVYWEKGKQNKTKQLKQFQMLKKEQKSGNLVLSQLL